MHIRKCLKKKIVVFRILKFVIYSEKIGFFLENTPISPIQLQNNFFMLEWFPKLLLSKFKSNQYKQLLLRQFFKITITFQYIDTLNFGSWYSCFKPLYHYRCETPQIAKFQYKVHAWKTKPCTFTERVCRQT